MIKEYFLKYPSKIDRIVSDYPGKNNAYDITLSVDGKDVEMKYIKKAEYDLAMKMKGLLSPIQIEGLLPYILDYGKEMYDECDNNHAEDEAGAAL